MSYNWDGMVVIDKEEAIERYMDDKEVYLLYDDDTEAAAEMFVDILEHDGDFGYEKGDE